MKININNKEYEAVEDEEITPFPTDAITLDGITYNLTEANPKHEELMSEIMDTISTHFAPRRSGATNDCKEKVSSLITKALNT